jgi:hypothetical protein
MVRRMNTLRQVFAVVVRVEREVASVRDEDGIERKVPNDRGFEVGESVKLVLGDDDSVVRVLDT